MTPLVSVITIFLDAERFLDEAVESVLAQDYPSWELLLVDDGSTDRSGALARAWAARHPGRVRYVTHPGGVNRGMSASRNVGIAHARGSLLAFLDADDVWLPHKLTAQVGLAAEHPEVGMVCGPTQYWRSWRGDARASGDPLREIGVPGDTVVQPPALLVGMLREEVNAPATCTALLRRETVEEVGGFEESFRGMFEDQAFFAKVYRTAPVYVSAACHDRYRQHDQSACARAEATGRYHPMRPNPAHSAFLRWLQGYLRQHGEQHPEVLAALQSALQQYRHPQRVQARLWVHAGRWRTRRWLRRLLAPVLRAGPG